LLIPAGCLMLGQSASFVAAPPPPQEKLVLGVEWRLIRAGTVTIEKWPFESTVKLESAGIVSTLIRIQDDYKVHYEDSLCATSSDLESMEGKRHHQAQVTYDRSRNHASYVERDLADNKILKETGTDIPNCVEDLVGAFAKLRTMNVSVGQSAQIPVSDGRRSAAVKVTALEREDVKTPLGSFKAIRYETDLMNGVVYTRNLADRRCQAPARPDPAAHQLSHQHRDAHAGKGGASMKRLAFFAAAPFAVGMLAAGGFETNLNAQPPDALLTTAELSALCTRSGQLM
jgi:hypothetical protein